MSNEHEFPNDEIQEIIGQIPPWIVRWGITTLSIVFLLFIACSFIIRFPETVPAKVTISNKVQPFRVSWYRNGPHEHVLYVKEGQSVKIGDTLLIERSLIDQSLTPVINSVNGRVLLVKGTAEEARKTTLIVTPSLHEFESQAILSPTVYGNVHEGQRILINLDAFPANEFGLLEGVLIEKIPVLIKGNYRVRVRLSNGFITTNHKQIPSQPVLMATGEIILDETTLFHKIFGAIF
ncbi:hypothetical protein [Spirosoma sp.]|uniref:hypothetical protein n=1 Tax=Spirosoma sp. TaxID=1899569 RepID=UPI00262BF82D|nr:hypothetical protein [Spirosoma sp.]MCX6212978.1 hypothetical protein [Spirosoma sp.]